MSLGLPGLSYGLAIAVGFPLALVSVLAGAGELVGSGTAISWFHPIVAGLAFVVAGVGLHGLSKRLEIRSTPLNVTVLVGVTLGVLGSADVHYSGRFFGWYAVPAALVLLILSLAMMSPICIRERTFGVLSWFPLAVTISAGVFFLSLLPGLGGGYRDAAQATALVVHVVLWSLLGVVLAGDPSWLANSVPSTERD